MDKIIIWAFYFCQTAVMSRYLISTRYVWLCGRYIYILTADCIKQPQTLILEGPCGAGSCSLAAKFCRGVGPGRDRIRDICQRQREERWSGLKYDLLQCSYVTSIQSFPLNKIHHLSLCWRGRIPAMKVKCKILYYIIYIYIK